MQIVVKDNSMYFLYYGLHNHARISFVCRIKKIFKILDKNIPEASIELEYNGDEYLLLISVVLSAQSTDKQVNKATEKLFLVASTPQQILDLGYTGLCDYISSINLYKTKARNIIGLSEKLIREYNSVIPDNRKALMSLPGVGKKTADVILNVIFKQATVAVDTHIFRVSKRLELSNLNNRDKMSVELENNLPQFLDHTLMIKAHHLLVLHGRYTCKAIKPNCHTCPLQNLCTWPEKKQFI